MKLTQSLASDMSVKIFDSETIFKLIEKRVLIKVP